MKFAACWHLVQLPVINVLTTRHLLVYTPGSAFLLPTCPIHKRWCFAVQHTRFVFGRWVPWAAQSFSRGANPALGACVG